MTAYKPVMLECGVALGVGETLISLMYLERRTGWTRDKVRWFLRQLTKRETIEVARRTPHGTVYGVVNWQTYQDPRDLRARQGVDKPSQIVDKAAGATGTEHHRQHHPPAPPLQLEEPGLFEGTTPPPTPPPTPPNVKKYKEEEQMIPAVSSAPLDRLVNGQELRGNELASAITGAFILRFEQRTGTRPPEQVIRKQYQPAKRIARMVDADPKQALMAIVGLEQVYPWDAEGERPWDCFTLEKQFPVAVQAFHSHPELAQERYWAEFAAIREEKR